jgi:hypothetical protein
MTPEEVSAWEKGAMDTPIIALAARLVCTVRLSRRILPSAQSAGEFSYVSNGGLACDSMLSETSGTRAARLGQSLLGHSPPWPPILRSRRAVLMPIMKPATTSIKVAIMIKKNTDVAAW